MACPNSDFFFFLLFFARVAEEFSEVARDARDTRILHWRDQCMYGRGGFVSERVPFVPSTKKKGTTAEYPTT